MGRKTGSMAETTRPRIRAAAARLFAEAGYDAVTMRQIGADAGLCAGALYRCLPDKESLAAELPAEAVEERDRALDGAAEGTPIEALEGVTRAYLAPHMGSGGRAALIALMSGAPGGGAARALEDRIERLLAPAGGPPGADRMALRAASRGGMTAGLLRSSSTRNEPVPPGAEAAGPVQRSPRALCRADGGSSGKIAGAERAAGRFAHAPRRRASVARGLRRYGPRLAGGSGAVRRDRAVGGLGGAEGHGKGYPAYARRAFRRERPRACGDGGYRERRPGGLRLQALKRVRGKTVAPDEGGLGAGGLVAARPPSRRGRFGVGLRGEGDGRGARTGSGRPGWQAETGLGGNSAGEPVGNGGLPERRLRPHAA